ncbi:MAG: IS3 family transposase [Propionibacteriaceae bacterium]|nr:IS3 family transposase [Propionibacteriaceae bacterium]
MAHLLSVSRSGYYQWRAKMKAGPSKRETARAALDERVRQSHQASDATYGAPRVTADLRANGAAVNVKTVAKSMRRQGLEGVSPRKFKPVTTIPGAPAHRIPDLVKRRWDTGSLNQVWVF